MKHKTKNEQITLVVRNDDGFISPYSPTEKPVISTDVSDFIENSAKEFHPNTELSLVIYSNCIDEKEKIIYKDAIKNSFTLKLSETKRLTKRLLILSLIFTFIGIIGLILMFYFSNHSKNEIWIECLDIFAWVFIWEAVDILFIQRKAKGLEIKRINAFINMNIIYKELNE